MRERDSLFILECRVRVIKGWLASEAHSIAAQQRETSLNRAIVLDAAAESEVSPNPHLSPHILPSTCLHSIRKSSPYEIGNRNGSAVSVAGSIPHALSCTQPEIVSLILFLDSVVLVRLQSVKLVHPRY